jgi:hypothetical protein
MQLVDRADWALMIAIHEALRRDLDPWALASASPDLREHVLSRLPAAARLLYRTVWLPRYTRTIPPL